jgi:hypothetical protein
MFFREHLEIHVEYKGAFLEEDIPSPTLGSSRIQHMSNPHNFEIWPVEGGPEKL